METDPGVVRFTRSYRSSFNKKQNIMTIKKKRIKGFKKRNDIIFKEVMAIVSTSQRG